MNPLLPHQNHRLLVIDDNHSIHDDFRKILKPGETTQSALDTVEASLFGDQPSAARSLGFEIDSALQGQEGLARVQKAVESSRPYALAFIDVRMPPGWDGIETTARIWAVDPDLQVVICTAYSDYSWEEMIAKVGQTDRLVFLKKPFDNVEVLQLANALTEKWRLLQQVKSKVENLEQMVATRTAECLKSEERFRLIAENAADLIAVVDLEGKRVYSSPSYGKVLGHSAAELEKHSALIHIHPDDQAEVRDSTQACVQTGVGQILEYRMASSDGSWRVLESQANPVRNIHGDVEHLVIVSRDITERKKAEQERKLMELQLRQAQKLEAIGQLAAGIAHEINTPTQYIGDNTRFLKDAFQDLTRVLERYRALLQAVKSKTVGDKVVVEAEQAVQTADLEYLVAEIPNAINQSLSGVESVAKIVHAMKEFSHPGTNEKVPIDLNHAIENTLTVCRNEWKYVAEISTHFDANLPPVRCLPGEINQAILNIVVNAAHAIADVVGDATTGKGHMTVRTSREGEWAEIRIADTGTGIPESARNRIFDPFFTTKGVGKGTGQGLAITHAVVVEKHGGTISFETQLGQGTTFIIRLPLSGCETALLEQFPTQAVA